MLNSAAVLCFSRRRQENFLRFWPVDNTQSDFKHSKWGRDAYYLRDFTIFWCFKFAVFIYLIVPSHSGVIISFLVNVGWLVLAARLVDCCGNVNCCHWIQRSDWTFLCIHITRVCCISGCVFILAVCDNMLSVERDVMSRIWVYEGTIVGHTWESKICCICTFCMWCKNCSRTPNWIRLFLTVVGRGKRYCLEASKCHVYMTPIFIDWVNLF